MLSEIDLKKYYYYLLKLNLFISYLSLGLTNITES